MLFNKIISLSLLAIQATLGIAGPASLHDRRVIALENQEGATNGDSTAHLLRRAHRKTESGVIKGTAEDSLETYGLATCVGLAAVGTAGADGTNKVLTHARCSPPGGGTFHDQVDEWANTIASSDMTVSKVVISAVEPKLVPIGLRPMQENLNNYAIAGAEKVTELNNIVKCWRQSMADPLPGGSLEIKQNGDIWCEGAMT